MLRSYRALEAAVQGVLALSGINPWRFEPSKLPKEQQQELQMSLGYTPRELTLYSGIVTLQAIGRVQIGDSVMKSKSG